MAQSLLERALHKVAKWARARSIWMIHYCSACGAVEFPMIVMSPLDWERYGYSPAPTPRQCDLYMGMGYLTKKSVKMFLNMYRQMPEHRVVAAGCNCTATGGLYWDSYATYKRLDDFVEVEGWVPGCMPMPDDYFSLLLHLRKMMEERPLSEAISRIRPDAFDKIRAYEEEERRLREEYEKRLAEEKKAVSYEFSATYPECYERDDKRRVCRTSVERTRIVEALAELKSRGYVLFVNIDAVDYPEKGVIELYYIVERPDDGWQTWVKTFVERANPVIDTVSHIYPLALYVEREVYEMMGVVFSGHPRLEKWILDGNWEGPPPLRKDVDTAGFVVKLMYGGYRYGR